MFSPGSKGWISKFLELYPLDELEVVGYASNSVSFFGGKTGLAFGFPSQYIFCGELDKTVWTQNERMAVLLFESLLSSYLSSSMLPSKEEFLEKCTQFYENHRVHSIADIISFFIKDSSSEQLEKIIMKRVDIPVHITKANTWLSKFDNSFIFLDVLLFDLFVQKNLRYDFSDLVKSALVGISYGAQIDGELSEVERNFFKTFLESADLSPKEKETAFLQFENGVDLSLELQSEIGRNAEFQRYILLLASLTVCLSENNTLIERRHLQKVFESLNLPPDDLENSLLLAQNFLLENNHQLNYFMDTNNLEKMLSHTSKRWVKVLGRNKDKLAKELSESKELLALIRKSTSQTLTKEEKEKVKTQFMDIVKSMPALAIFLLPGGALLLPLLLKIIPTLVPSAFRNNELEND